MMQRMFETMGIMGNRDHDDQGGYSDEGGYGYGDDNDISDSGDSYGSYGGNDSD